MSNRDHRSGPGTSSADGGKALGGSPGKRTLTQMLQRKAAAPAAAAPAAQGPAAAGADPQAAAGNDGKAAGIVARAMARRQGKDAGAGAQGTESAAAASETAPAAQVQMDGGDAATDPDLVHGAALDGVAGAGGSLPHGDAIQRSFGAEHDVSNVSAHVGGAAADACDTIGATAYATGNDVAFASSPDLHTAAHEAAHVVQQRSGVQLYGGVGEAGDIHEQHADAVADRVVAGESAGDLLAAYTGGGGSAAVQRQEAAPAATGAPAGGTAAASTEHYEVELKAWIPHDKVVDPEEPMRISDWLDTIEGLVDGVLDSLPFGAVGPRLKYDYHSYYRGDNHTGYAGGHRVLSKVEFDFDGTTITNFSHSGSAGATHRDYDYRAWIEFLFGAASIDVTSGSGTESDTASGTWTGKKVGANSFQLGFASANPVVMTWAPDIDSDGSGTMGSGLTLSYDTDLFPSHGVRVVKNGTAVKTQVVNDASGVHGLGPIGAALIGHRLTSQTNAGTVTAP